MSLPVVQLVTPSNKLELITMTPPSYVEVEVVRRVGLLTPGDGFYSLVTECESL